jgi:internalin A
VTDAGVKELAPLKQLTNLFLFGTSVTDDGVQELQKALPKCEVVIVK